MRHRHFNLLLVSMVFLPLMANSQTAEDKKRLEEFRAIVSAPVVLPQNGPYKVKATSDISYPDSKESYRKLDIYQPDQGRDTKKFPLVILIHGKTPVETDPRKWNGYVTWAKLVAGNGFVTMAFTHSLAIPGKSVEAAGTDLLDIIQYAKLNHAQYNIDTTRIALIGYSAGVVLLSEAFIQKNSSPKCLVAFYGFMDITAAPLFKEENKNTLERFSLVNYVKDADNFPPMLVARAGKENNPDLNRTIDSFLMKANAGNIPVTFVNHPAGVHGFDTQTNDARSREIVGQVVNFLQSHLR
jgi:acetyl esterase/lipase